MSSVTFLLRRCREGRSSAFGELVARFYACPVRLAQQRMGRAVAIPEDGEDIAQRVFLELHRSVQQGSPLGMQVCDTESLLKALTILTRQQIRRQWRNHTRQCRDARRTRLLTDLCASGESDALDGIGDQSAQCDLGQIELQETTAQLLAVLPSARHRSVAQLRAQGYDVTEIATEVGRSVRAVQRYLVEIQGIWRRHCQR